MALFLLMLPDAEEKATHQIGDEPEHKDNGHCPAEIRPAISLLIGHDVQGAGCVERPSACRRVDDLKRLEGIGYAKQGGQNDVGKEPRKLHVPEHLPSIGSIDTRCFLKFGGYGLKTGKQDHN